MIWVSDSSQIDLVSTCLGVLAHNRKLVLRKRDDHFWIIFGPFLDQFWNTLWSNFEQRIRRSKWPGGTTTVEEQSKEKEEEK